MITCAFVLALALAEPSPTGQSSEAPAVVSDARALRLMAQLREASGAGDLDRHDAFHETGTVIRFSRPELSSHRRHGSAPTHTLL